MTIATDSSDSGLTLIRERVCKLARASVGLGAYRKLDLQGNMGEPGDGYRTLIADGETVSMARSMTNMSGCALVVRGIWRLAGLVDPRLSAPYRVGSAIATIVAMAHEAGASRRPGGPLHSETPTEGDVLYLTTPQEHVCTFMGCYSDSSGEVWITIDGGQRDGAGGELVKRCSRTWTAGSLLDGRDVGLVIDLDALASRFLAAAPGDA